ncbi:MULTISPECIES: hypothetical protein [Streptomyces]|uniref:hypothetical protein n=1 Tax=Streptomyces TaxID=1883 RepID=UPI0029BEA2F5|nr:hypothetical protein [Streptomyces sp. WI03-4A]MDX2595129.1 hypothetical protein [Streptomyces sp. WI03-4A]
MGMKSKIALSAVVGVVGDGSCSWERTEDAEQSLDSIIANDNVTGTAVVTVRAIDAYFKTTGCGDWKKTG